ncbi:MAG TPA: hypothetical protein VFW65_28810 [Pseudonocardiaceae bacterium]|nr:hypothetical protein [Pseudonocardiaceae bacterium]
MSTIGTTSEPISTPARTFAARVRAFFNPRPARWRTVIAWGIVLAYADGYILVALTGAVGAIQRTAHPFTAWMEESAVLVPVFILTELLVLRLIRRRTGPRAQSGKVVLVAALLIAIGGTVTGVLALTASAAYDYNLQTQLIDFSAQFSDQPGDPLIKAGATVARGNCNTMVCDQERFSLATDVRGVGVGAPLLLVINVVLVGLVLAGFGGRLGAVVPESIAGSTASDADQQA